MADRRNEFAKAVEEVGKRLADIRVELNATPYPFCAGMVRAAEEALVVVYNALKDQGNVLETEL